VIAGLLQACAPQAVQRPTLELRPTFGSGIQRIAFDSTGRRLATGDLHGHVRIWSVTDGAELRSFKHHHARITGLDWLDDARLISVDRSGYVLISDAASGEPLTAVQLGAVNDLAVAPDHSWLVVTDDVGIRKLLLPGLQVEAWRSLSASPLAIAIDHSGERIAASDKDGAVRLLNARLQTLGTLPRPSRDLYDLTFSPDDETLLGGGWFRLVTWHLPGGALREYPTPHLGKINSVAISPDGAHWLSLGRETDSQFLMTDRLTHRVERHFQSHALCGSQARFSPDGRYAASASDDGSVHLYDLNAPYRLVVPYFQP
jgi:WD40 repeat protein